MPFISSATFEKSCLFACSQNFSLVVTIVALHFLLAGWFLVVLYLFGNIFICFFWWKNIQVAWMYQWWNSSWCSRYMATRTGFGLGVWIRIKIWMT